MLDQNEFLRGMAELCSKFRVPLTEEMNAEYFQALRNELTTKEFLWACKKAFTGWIRGDFPTPADLLRFASTESEVEGMREKAAVLLAYGGPLWRHITTSTLPRPEIPKEYALIVESLGGARAIWEEYRFIKSERALPWDAFARELRGRIRFDLIKDRIRGAISSSDFRNQIGYGDKPSTGFEHKRI